MLELNENQKDHHRLIKSIITNLNNTPLTLVGGTALYLCYKLNRFSVDIDLDTNKKININNKIKNSLPHGIKLVGEIKHFKDTPINSKYKVEYINTKGKENSLIIEMKIKENEIPHTLIDNIKVAPIEYLIQNKIDCLANRTKARDLFDINFLITNYPDKFNNKNINDLNSYVKQNDLISKYLNDWLDNALLPKIDITDVIINLSNNLEKIKNNMFNKELLKATQKQINDNKGNKKEILLD